MDIRTLDRWHKTRTGHLIFGLAEIALAYLFASLAIDSGSLWEYAAAIILLAGGMQNLVKIFRASKHEHKRR
jgi:predicted acyltransferase